MEVKVKKLSEDAVIPEYAHQHDGCMDLTATSITITDKFVEYGTGLAMEIPAGSVGLVFPRSSVSKKDLTLANSVGVIDAQYRGEIKLRFKLHNSERDTYKVGERIGQIMIIPRPSVTFKEVNELEDTDRSSGGFGSTGS
jgi:dUTP pyrophosphatase